MVATPDLGSGAERRGGSSPFIRKSQRENSSAGRAQPCQGWGRGFESRFSLTVALVVELVDTQDLKSCASFGVRVQVPPGVLKNPLKQMLQRVFCFSFVLQRFVAILSPIFTAVSMPFLLFCNRSWSTFIFPFSKSKTTVEPPNLK